MFVYNVQAAFQYTTHGTPGTEDPTIALRQVTRGFWLQMMSATGKAAADTSITGIAIRVRRWTTAGSGGTTLTPSPRYALAPAAVTIAADKQTALTPGTVSGAYQCGFGFGAAGANGWNAINWESAIHVEAGSSDELNLNSVCGVASKGFELTGEIAE